MLIIDLQGFVTPNFIPKEMAITDGEHTSHYVFKPPFPFRSLEPRLQRAAKWIVKNYHGLNWNSGFVELSQMDAILRQVTERENVIYCKGKQKADYLRQHTKVIVKDLDDIEQQEEDGYAILPLSSSWKPPCFSHSLNICSCTLNNVNYIYREILNKINN